MTEERSARTTDHGGPAAGRLSSGWAAWTKAHRIGKEADAQPPRWNQESDQRRGVRGWRFDNREECSTNSNVPDAGGNAGVFVLCGRSPSRVS
jgi:hypothetical protein